MGFVAYQNGRAVVKRSGAFVIITSSMRTETEVENGCQVKLDSSHGIVVTDSQSVLRKTEKKKFFEENG